MATTEAIWHGLHERLLRSIRRHVADTASAEDILQDVFLKIHTRIGTLRDEERLEGWVYQIVRNAIADQGRRQRPSGPLTEELVDPATPDEDDADSAARQLIPFIGGAVADLPEPYREALLLTEYGGLTQQQLAERVGISLSGAKSRVQRGRERLKQLLLDCCHVELDRRGGITDYQGHCARCANGRLVAAWYCGATSALHTKRIVSGGWATRYRGSPLFSRAVARPGGVQVRRRDHARDHEPARGDARRHLASAPKRPRALPRTPVRRPRSCHRSRQPTEVDRRPVAPSSPRCRHAIGSWSSALPLPPSSAI